MLYVCFMDIKVNKNCANCPFYEWEEHNNLGINMGHVCNAKPELDFIKLNKELKVYTEIHPECPLLNGHITVSFKSE